MEAFFFLAEAVFAALVGVLAEAERLAGYVTTLRRELLRLSRACGVPHPGMVGPDQLEILDGHYRARTLSEVFEYGSETSGLAAAQRDTIKRIMLTLG